MSLLSCGNMVTYKINPIRLDTGSVTGLEFRFRSLKSHSQSACAINLDRASDIRVPQGALYSGMNYSGNGKVYLCENFCDYRDGGAIDVVVYDPISIKMNSENEYSIENISQINGGPIIAYFLDRVVGDRVVTTLSGDGVFSVPDHLESISFPEAIKSLGKDVSLLLADRQPMISYLDESEKYDAGFILQLGDVYYWLN